jgi:cyclophilin family peptidyl-prolyl cis-trans isomerase
MRAGGILRRGAKGYGWYAKFLKEGSEGFSQFVPPTPFDWSAPKSPRPSAYFEISVDDKSVGRLNFELAEDIVPETVANFKKLCTNAPATDGGVSLSYKDTTFHRVMKSSAILGGDVEKGDGSMSHSATGTRYFADENYIIPHSEKGLLSMMSSGVDTNGSQFCLALEALPHLNGRNVVFGRLVGGEEVIERIEEVFTFRGAPAKDVKIIDAGVVEA